MKRHSGYLLIEVLITLAITAVTVSALVRFQVELHQGAALAAQRSDALMLAAAKMEVLTTRLHAGTAIPADGADSGPLHDRQWTLSASGHDDRLIRIEVTVDWQGIDQQSHQIRLTGLAEPAASLLAAYAADI